MYVYAIHQEIRSAGRTFFGTAGGCARPAFRRAAAARLATALMAAGGFLWLGPGPGGAQEPPGGGKLRSLIERIAKGDEVESADATRQLTEQMVAPLVEAIGPLEARPAAEQVRIRRALTRISATLRVRLLRADLPEEDRRLLDEFVRSYDDLVLRLFDENYRVRAEAVGQIPLEPGSGAGVLICAKVNDEDEEVAVAALDAARKLRDPVVARGLRRYVEGATEAIRSGFYRPSQQELAMTVALFVKDAIVALGEARAADSVPTILDALRYFAGTPLWTPGHVGEVAVALGRIGDERAAPLLLELLKDESFLRRRTTEEGRAIVQTVGDLALLSLLRIYQLEAGSFGLHTLPGADDFAGFTSPGEREAARQAFHRWYEDNARRPAGERQPPASRPVVQPGDRR
jgi:hypothetical protein